MTPFITSPFFTLEFGFASFTDTTMRWPRDAYLRRAPPSTLMHRTRRAPELSATSRTVSDCTMSVPPRWRLPRSAALLHDAAHPPALVLAERTGLGDHHPVA